MNRAGQRLAFGPPILIPISVFSFDFIKKIYLLSKKKKIVPNYGAIIFIYYINYWVWSLHLISWYSLEQKDGILKATNFSSQSKQYKIINKNIIKIKTKIESKTLTSLRKEWADRSSVIGAAMAKNLLFFTTSSAVARSLRVVYDGGAGGGDDIFDRLLIPGTLSDAVLSVLTAAAVAWRRTEHRRGGTLTAIGLCCLLERVRLKLSREQATSLGFSQSHGNGLKLGLSPMLGRQQRSCC